MKRNTIIILIGAMFLFGGCKKFIQVPAPVTQLVTSSVFNSNSTATSAQTVIYSDMFGDYSMYCIGYYTGQSVDELTNVGPTDLTTNALTAINDASMFSENWETPYNYIFQANSVIEGLQSYSGVTPAAKQQLTGEALFTRAFWHYYLMQLFGEVAIVTTTNYQANATVSRVPQAAVYLQIVQDLTQAQEMLNPNFIDASDTIVTTERVRPTQSAAEAFLARVYLYTSKWDSAEMEATAVINNPMFTLDTGLNSVFLMNSKEAIWQLQAAPTTYHTTDGLYNILTGAGTGLSQWMMAAFEPGDKRRVAWVDSVIASGMTYYFSYKYKAGGSSTTLTEYKMMFRLAEQYLIRAEARAQQGNMTGNNSAVSDLNAIRERAGLPDYSGATDKTSVLNAIAHERQVELFTEWGDRWFNLRRSGALDSVMTAVNPLKGGMGWQSFQQYYPIPLADIGNDPNLKQTTGY